jgi:acyl-CoA synthetase (AMP-forming)/AMP-acid ligase II
VLGIEDVRLGERVVAAVELKPNKEATPEELITHVGDRLARYKVPQQIVIVDRLPRNAMSKVVKRDLLHLFRSEKA